jgi:hypothetical protein
VVLANSRRTPRGCRLCGGRSYVGDVNDVAPRTRFAVPDRSPHSIMMVTENRPGQIVTGPHFNEPMRIAPLEANGSTSLCFGNPGTSRVLFVAAFNLVEASAAHSSLILIRRAASSPLRDRGWRSPR